MSKYKSGEGKIDDITETVKSNRVLIGGTTLFVKKKNWDPNVFLIGKTITYQYTENHYNDKTYMWIEEAVIVENTQGTLEKDVKSFMPTVSSEDSVTELLFKDAAEEVKAVFEDKDLWGDSLPEWTSEDIRTAINTVFIQKSRR